MIPLKYPGVLGVPIGPRPRESNQQETYDQHARDRVVALCDLFGIEFRFAETDWRTLAIKLAILHVPGFSQSTRGRKRKRDTLEALNARKWLLEAVEKEKEEPKLEKRMKADEAILRKLLRIKPTRMPAYYQIGARSVARLKSDLGLARAERNFRKEVAGKLDHFRSLKQPTPADNHRP